MGEHGAVVVREGDVWQSRVGVRSTALFTVWGCGADRVHVAGAQGVYRTDHHGRSWRAVTTGVANHIVAVRGAGPGALVALTGGIGDPVGRRGRAVEGGSAGHGARGGGAVGGVADGAHRGGRARRGGAIERRRALVGAAGERRAGGPLCGVPGSARDDVWAVGSSGTIVHSRDAGETWETRASGTMADLTGVWGSARSDVYAVGKGGTVLHLDGTGEGMDARHDGHRRDPFGVWGSGADDVYAVGSGGVVLHATRGGTRWALEESGTAEDLLAGAGQRTRRRVRGGLRGHHSASLVRGGARATLCSLQGDVARITFNEGTFCGSGGEVTQDARRQGDWETSPCSSHRRKRAEGEPSAIVHQSWRKPPRPTVQTLTGLSTS